MNTLGRLPGSNESDAEKKKNGRELLKVGEAFPGSWPARAGLTVCGAHDPEYGFKFSLRHKLGRSSQLLESSVQAVRTGRLSPR